MRVGIALRVAVAAAVGMLVVLAGAPAQAKTTITVTLTLARSQYADGEEIRPTAKLNGLVANPAITGQLRFERYASPGCNGSRSTLSTPNAGGGTITGPNYSSGDLGRHSMKVTYPGDTNYNPAASSCVDYAQQRQSQVGTDLPKQTFTTSEQIRPSVTLNNVQANAGGSVEYQRWVGSNGCTGPAATLGSSPVVNRVVQQSFDHQDGKLGVHEYRARYSGDDDNRAADSSCEAYLVGTHIRGRLFVDTDADGVLDGGEPGLGNVQIALRKGAASVAMTDTAADGAYEFFVTEAATFTVAPNRLGDYRATTPEKLDVPVSGPPVTGRNFGIAKIVASPSASSSTSESPSPSPSQSESPSAEPSPTEEPVPSEEAVSEPVDLPSPAGPPGGLSDIGIYGLFCGGAVVIIGSALLVLTLRRRPDRLGDL
ncbi:hypothetical protein F4553_005497 [Allocatelliglobosispora scoriae]|uniref:SD-repeat containing protein B domain-containing protein n=1 Tax=Allocatelliglobosispora scoriae TaxID=643052 RepID=A0A841BYR2_9ACTN|nr:SdrD B-like domain-containing protein [Allocatelliglobosispora scoriae]MBB5872063.1 hypothetical protein [Allocatelliglobosispora scoriae]